jgi:hypothetical protein
MSSNGIIKEPAVIDDRQSAARTADAMQLSQRAIAVKPVKRLTDRCRVDRRILERDLFGYPSEQLDVRQRGGQTLPHCGHRLDRYDRRASGNEHSRELAGSRRDVQHLPAAAKL